MSLTLTRSERRAADASPRKEAPQSRLARRFGLPRVRDVRWIIGVLLLIAGVLTTTKVIAAFDDSVTAWTASRTLLPGEKLKPSDMRAARVRLDQAERQYFVGAKAPSGVVQQVINKGEMVARASIGHPASVNVRTVTVHVDAGTTEAIRVGQLVEVWVAKKVQDAGTDRFEKPQKITERAVVAKVGANSNGIVSVADGQPVSLLVPQAQLADVIDAVNSKSRVTLVPLVAGGAS